MTYDEGRHKNQTLVNIAGIQMLYILKQMLPGIGLYDKFSVSYIFDIIFSKISGLGFIEQHSVNDARINSEMMA